MPGLRLMAHGQCERKRAHSLDARARMRSPPRSSSYAASAQLTHSHHPRRIHPRAQTRNARAIDDIRKAGVGPVDMQQSVIGPGMGVFTRYAKVLENDDSPMSVKTALSLINRVWEEIENELDANFDPETQVALAWFATYGFDTRGSGELISLANAKNIPLGALFNSGVFTDLHGKAALTPRADLPTDWIACNRRNADGLGMRAAHRARVERSRRRWRSGCRLVAQMGPKAADARALAYRLYEICSQKGWAGEALVYNELAQEWARLEDIAINMASPARTTTSARARSHSMRGPPDVRRKGNFGSRSERTVPSSTGPHALRQRAYEGRARGSLAPLREPCARLFAFLATRRLRPDQDDDRPLA